MKTTKTKIMTTSIALGLLMATASPTLAYVDKDHWASEAIDHVITSKIMEGTSENEFSPEKKITLGEFITTLGKYHKIDKEKYSEKKDDDTKETKYYTEYMNWAAESKLLSDIKKSAEEEITREETAHILASYLRFIGDDISTLKYAVFEDESEISEWAKGDTQFLANKGIMKGTSDNKFSPKESLTRAEVAQIMYNLSK